MRVIIKFEVNLLSPNLLEFKSFTFSLFCNCPEIFLLHRHFLFSVNWMKNVFLIQSHFDNNYRPQPKFAKVMFSQVFVCPQGEGSLSRGVSVQGVSIWGVSVQGVSVHSGISIQWGICLGVLCGCLCLICLCLGGLCPGKGSLSREGVSVQGRGLCPGKGSLSGEGVSVCPGGLCPQWDLYPVGYLSGGSLWVSLSDLSMSRGSLSGEGSLSRGLCPGWVSVQGVSVQWHLCPGGLCQGGPPPQYGNVRAVCLPLECILVLKIFSTCKYLRNMISETSQNKHNHFTILITLSINLFNFESRPTPNFSHN